MSFLTSLRQSATRRRTAAGVRVHPDAGQVPSPSRHRRPARDAAGAMRQIEAEAPLQPRVRTRDALAVSAVALEGVASYRDQLLGWAADDETMARDLRMRAARYRQIAGGIDTLLELPRAVAFGHLVQQPQAAADEDRPARGPRCFGCGRPGDTVPCWNEPEGRVVPLCPACHPSADAVDDSGADGEEPISPIVHAATEWRLPACGEQDDPDGELRVAADRGEVTCPRCTARLAAADAMRALRTGAPAPGGGHHAAAADTEPDPAVLLPFAVMLPVGDGDEPAAVVARFATRAEADSYTAEPGDALAGVRDHLYVVGPAEAAAPPEARTSCAHTGCPRTSFVTPGHSFWCSDHVGDILGNDEPDLSEALASGPAAVPQLRQRRDTETVRLPWGAPVLLDDTLTGLEGLEGRR